MGQTASDTSVCATHDGNETSGEKNRNLSTNEDYSKLNNDQKVEIVKMLAEFVDIPTIQYEIDRKYGIKLSTTGVKNYKTAEKWIPMYKKFRKEYVESVESVPGAHKRVRLERMEKLWEKAETDEDIRNAISVTEHQRKEIEGEGSKHQGDNILIQFNGMSDDELQKELNNTIEYIKKLEKKKVIDAEVINANV
jgi:hypothetical protein